MLVALTLLSALFTAPATDSIAGTWQIRGDVVGSPLNEICTLKQADTVVSGSCTGEDGKAREVTGEVKEGKITFRHGGEYEGQALTIVFTGTLASPTEIKGTLQVQPFDVGGEFTATPAQTPARP